MRKLCFIGMFLVSLLQLISATAVFAKDIIVDFEDAQCWSIDPDLAEGRHRSYTQDGFTVQGKGPYDYINETKSGSFTGTLHWSNRENTGQGPIGFNNLRIANSGSAFNLLSFDILSDLNSIEVTASNGFSETYQTELGHNQSFGDNLLAVEWVDLHLTSLGGGMRIDNVYLQSIPSPATVLLFCSGLLVACVIGRKRMC